MSLTPERINRDRELRKLTEAVYQILARLKRLEDEVDVIDRRARPYGDGTRYTRRRWPCQ